MRLLFKIIILLNLFFTLSINSNISDLNKIINKLPLKPNDQAQIIVNAGIINITQVPENPLEEKIKSVIKGSNNTLQLAKKIISENKVAFSVGSFSVSYLFILYKLSLIDNLLNDPNSWHNWKSDLSFETLISISHVEICQELSSEINKRFFEKDTKEVSSPQIDFINAVNFELSKLQYYMRLTKCLKIFHVTMFFGIKNDTVNLIQEKINKLKYLKNIFLNNILEPLNRKK